MATAFMLLKVTRAKRLLPMNIFKNTRDLLGPGRHTDVSADITECQAPVTLTENFIPAVGNTAMRGLIDPGYRTDSNGDPVPVLELDAMTIWNWHRR